MAEEIAYRVDIWDGGQCIEQGREVIARSAAEAAQSVWPDRKLIEGAEKPGQLAAVVWGHGLVRQQRPKTFFRFG